MTLHQEKIKEHIVHRYENLLLDTISISEQNNGTLSLTINTPDPLNRDLFLKEYLNNKHVLSPPLFMEILALESIVVSGKLAADELAIFAGISDFKVIAPYHANQKLTGSVKKINAKKDFLKYQGQLESNNQCVATGSMTAFFSKVSNLSTPTTPSEIRFEKTIKRSIDKKNRHKPESMIITDQLIDIKKDSYTAIYTYPNNHPLTKGHFPNNPIMMGVMQWMSIEDSLCFYLEETNQAGNNQWSCDAMIYNQDYVKIADLKQIQLTSWINHKNIKNQTEITATKRINFRSMVKPNDSLYIHVFNIIKE